MRDFVLFFVNGRRFEIRGAEAFLTLSEFLRNRLGMIGTKIVCSEGDCGSCTVLVGTRGDGNQLDYRSIDSCIRFVFQLDGVHVVTVEGLACHESAHCSDAGTRLNEVQQAMIDCHGSQCGFCTPGFVVAMTGLLQDQQRLSVEKWRRGLTGNLCRCTGYSPIVEAGLQAQAEKTKSLNQIYPANDLIDEIAATNADSIEIGDDDENRVFCPGDLETALNLLAEYPDAKIVAGATDVGVQFNKGFCKAKTWIDLNRVREIEGVFVDGNTIVAGSRATWAELEDVTGQLVPEFEKIVAVFGGPQIRHAGTLGGNIINASPIADSLPLLFVCHAQLTLVSTEGTRTVDINDFYTGYKKFDLQAGELLTRIEIPLPIEKGSLRLYKISRRKDLDISSFTAAVWIETDGTDNGTLKSGSSIVSAKIAYGAVGPTVVRLPQTEKFLVGKSLNEQTMVDAGEIAVSEITPISDVRGGDEYRYNLARNVLVKFYHQTQKRPLAAV